MTDCVKCERPMADQAYACTACRDRTAEQLDAIADATPAARDIAHGLSRHAGGSGSSGKPESRLPLDLAATSKLDAVQGSLTTWARHIAETRHGATWGPAGDPVVAAARWLRGQLEWMRHRREAGEFLSDVAAAVRVVLGIARGPAEQKYLGPCGAPIPPEPRQPGEELVATWVDEACQGDVYAYRGARTGRCRTCGAEVATSEREAWLDGEVRGHAFRAAHIADAYGVNVKTIRTWASRPRPDTGVPPLASYWRTEAGLLTPWTETDDEAETEARGPRLHYVGDVLDLAAADAVRRAEQQSRRARRAEVEGVTLTTAGS
jgi:hypothetical protein